VGNNCNSIGNNDVDRVLSAGVQNMED